MCIDLIQRLVPASNFVFERPQSRGYELLQVISLFAAPTLGLQHPYLVCSCTSSRKVSALIGACRLERHTPAPCVNITQGVGSLLVVHGAYDLPNSWLQHMARFETVKWYWGRVQPAPSTVCLIEALTKVTLQRRLGYSLPSSILATHA